MHRTCVCWLAIGKLATYYCVKDIWFWFFFLCISVSFLYDVLSTWWKLQLRFPNFPYRRANSNDNLQYTKDRVKWISNIYHAKISYKNIYAKAIEIFFLFYSNICNTFPIHKKYSSHVTWSTRFKFFCSKQFDPTK